MEDLVGRRVSICYGNQMQYEAVGTVQEWDEVNEFVRLAPDDLILGFKDIAKIEVMDAIETTVAEALSARSYQARNVRFVMSSSVQFDNALYFQSAVSVWKGDRMACLEGIIVDHTDDTVTMQDGQIFNKTECQFTVKSILGSHI